MIVAKS